MICDNPKCKHHEPMPLQEDALQVQVLSDEYYERGTGLQQRLIVNRHKYKAAYSYFYLCDCCHGAVEFSKGKR